VAAVVLATGSAGTIASGDYVKQVHHGARIAAVEALQCPTMLRNGYGSHRIEGIGDKHIPWIHNARNTDVVIAVDDADPMAVLRLLNEPVGRDLLSTEGVSAEVVARLGWFGISGIANLLASISYAKRFHLTRDAVVLTVLTDSVDLYGSRIRELEAAEGAFTLKTAALAYGRILDQGLDNLLVLDDDGRRRIHNLKYFTWVEQQGKTVEDLDAQWSPGYWEAIQGQAAEVDRLITEFNARVAAV
jgi:hypothetical protein